MSTEPRKSLPSLVVSRACLNALNSLRSETNVAVREQAIETIVHAAGKPSEKDKRGSFEYVQSRLLNGVSVSTGHVRFNYTLALTALIRQTQSVGVTAPTAAALYTDAKAFDMSSSSAPRERALGALAAASALTAAAPPQLAVHIARDIFRVTRVAMDSTAVSWRLSLPSVLVVRRVLEKSSEASRNALVKPIWAICSQHPAKEHAFALALLLLLDMQLAKPSSVHALYPSLDGDFTTALLSTFSFGFSLLDTTQIGSRNGRPPSNIVPISWQLAVRYVTAPAEVKMMKDDLLSFWNNIVQKSIMTSEKSVEKRIFVLQLLPIVVKAIHDTDTFKAIFDGKLASFMNSFTEFKHLSRRLSKTAAGGFSAYLETYTSHLMDAINDSARPEKERRLLNNACLVWATKHDLTRMLFGKDRVAALLSSLDTNDVSVLLENLVQEFAAPAKDTAGNKKRLSRACTIRRLSIAKTLLSLADVHHFLANDIVRILTLFCVFQEPQTNEDTLQTPWVKFDVYKNDNPDFCGCLPKPDTTISVHIASTVFKRLADYLTTAGHKEGSNKLVKTCFETICAGILKDPSFSAVDNSAKLKMSLNKRIVCLIDSLKERKPKGELEAVFTALQDISLFLGVELMEPSVKKEDKGNKGQNDLVTYIEDEYGVLLDLMEEFISESSTTGRNKDDVEGDAEPEPIEKLSLLICELCGRPGTRFRQIALRAIEHLAPFVDDRVVAVLFDAMEMYRSGVETLSGAMVEGADDTSEKGEEAEENGNGVDEDETSEESDEAETTDVQTLGDDKEKQETVKKAHGSREKSEKAEENGNGDNGDESSSSESDETGTAEALEDDEEKQDTAAPIAANGNKDKESEDSDTEKDDVNIDIDEEDPKVLAELDKRLSLHVKLIQEERKAKKQEKAKGSELWRVHRVLHMVEVVARMLRLRLEREGHSSDEHPSDARVGLVFIDTLVRLYEFVFSNETDYLLVIDQVTDIVVKQMCVVSVPLLENKITDVQTLLESIDQFFESLVQFKHFKVLEKDNVRAISKATGLLLSVSVNMSDDISFSTFYDFFEKMVEKILSKDGYMCSAEVLSSFVQLAGDEALKLINPIMRAFETGLMKQRCLSASSLILSLATSAKSKSSSSNTLSKNALVVFWKNLSDIVHKHFTVESCKTLWTSASATNLVRAVAHVLTEEASWFEEKDALRSHVWSVLQSMRLKNSELSQLSRLIGIGAEITDGDRDYLKFKSEKNHGKEPTN